MLKYYFLFIISLFLFSCSSQYVTGNIPFTNRVGIYVSEDKDITVTILDKKQDNLIIKITSKSINDTLSVRGSSSGRYLTIDSETYSQYSYRLNFGNSLSSIVFTLRENNTAVIFNEKLSIQN